MASMQVLRDTRLAPTGKAALQRLPMQQASWVVVSALAAAIAGATTLWATRPELSLLFALGAGASAVNPLRLWTAPAVVTAVVISGVVCGAIGVPPIVVGGAMAGAIATLLVPHRTDALDVVNGALGGLIGAAIGLWAAKVLLPSSLPDVLLAPLTTGAVALLAAQGLLPVALRFSPGPMLPSASDIAALRAPYRPPIHRAMALYKRIESNGPDVDTRTGLAEVVSWIYRLQFGLQTLDVDLEQIVPSDIEERIQLCEAADDRDRFTRERKQATAQHLRRLLEHRVAIVLERERTEALVEYALAFLEEARAGSAVAHHVPGVHEPERLDEVLERLRSDAREGDLKRRAALEVDGR
jgi:hypothetical protein